MSEIPADRFHPALELEQIPKGQYLQCQVGDLDLLLCRLSDGVRAIQNRCSHMHMPLNGGRMIGCKIVCPEHSAEFDLDTGKALSFPAVYPLKTFATQIRDGIVYVQIV